MITTTIHEHRPFNLRYIVRQPSGIHSDDMRATHRTAACNYLYIVRENGTDEFGPTPDFAARRDLLARGRCGPVDRFDPRYAGIQLWTVADSASCERLPELATAMHAVGTLPQTGDLNSWRALIKGFGDQEFAPRGMVADWAIHGVADDAGGFEIVPHVHWLITARAWRLDRDPGRHQKPWLSTKAQVDRLADAWFALTGLYPEDYRKPAV